MGAIGLKDISNQESRDSSVSLDKLAEMTGFPVDFIKKELMLPSMNDLELEELRGKVLSYLNQFN